MKNYLSNFLIFYIFLFSFTHAIKAISNPIIISSPSNKIKIEFINSADGIPKYRIFYNDIQVTEFSSLGIKTADSDFSKNLKIISLSDKIKINETYELKFGKKRVCNHNAIEQTITMANFKDEKFEIIFRVADDGIAFRYHFPEKSENEKLIIQEVSSFNFFPETKAWLHPHRNAQTGWCKTQPSYEEYYYQEIPVGTPAPEEAGWSFPALFKYKNCWFLITESNVTPDYCGTRLAQFSPEGEYFIQFPQKEERISEKESYLPIVKFPLYTPWRIIIIGNLSDIVESTLVTDLAMPSKFEDISFIKPGRASWSWALLKDNSVVYDVQKKFIDYAANMGWEYCLIDVDWDKRIGYEKIKELVQYASTKNVGIILWYNSSGSWNTTTYSPKNIMNDPIKRKQEMEKLANIGVKGIKVDFWGGDGQSMIKYYFDLFEDAAKYHLLVNCHGTTIPRGWERTFPNLVTMEAVRGFEFITFEQFNADSAPRHCAILPFTRNAIGPMDFTPVCFSEIPNIKRKTSNAFELALSVLFFSGIQHFAEIPEEMNKQPNYVINFMKNVPSTWEETKFIDGYPGNYVVLARKNNKKWYIAGINAMKNDIELELDLSKFAILNNGMIITDGENSRSFSMYKISLKNKKINLKIKSNGGFVIIFNEK